MTFALKMRYNIAIGKHFEPLHSNKPLWLDRTYQMFRAEKSTMWTRRQFSGAISGLGVLSTAMLEGCGRAKGASLEILGEDSSNLKAISSLLPEFTKNSGIEVTVEAASFDVALAKSTTDFSSGAGRYDIVLQYNFSLSPFVRNNYVYNVADLKKLASDVSFAFEGDLIPNVWKELGYYAVPPFTDLNKIQPIAYPFAANTMILTYNRKIFNDPQVSNSYRSAFGREFSPPSTWKELAQIAQLVKNANPSFRGIALQGAAGGWLYYEWVNFLFGLGGRVMNKEYGWQSDLTTPLQLNSPQAADSAELYLSLKDTNAGDFFSTDAVKQRDIMLEGKTAFAITWTDYVPDLVAKDGESFGFAPVPGPSSMIAGGCFFVNRKSKNPAAAARLISYLLSEPTQTALALRGLFPPTRSALNDAKVLAKPFMPAVRESLMRGIYMAEAGPDADLISQEITNALQRAWKGEIPSRDVGHVAMRAIQQGRTKL
jgi:ABC-type glycerol-3-phosphate transport system substrate-binding protein